MPRPQRLLLLLLLQPWGCLVGAGQHLGQVGQVAGDVVAEGVGNVLGQALDGAGPADQSLHGEANKGNLQQVEPRSARHHL